LLHILQSLKIFSILPYVAKKQLFTSKGTGDQTIFDVVVKTKIGSQQISVKDKHGQAHLTATLTVLHIEAMLNDDLNNGVYFSHQIHQSAKLYSLLNSVDGIVVNIKKFEE
jgi:hypothetical protein